MSTFSERLKQLREEKGITQSELAKAINKSRVTVTAYETDGRLPDLETTAAIADYFQEDIDWLMGRTDIREHPTPDEDVVSREAFKVLAEIGLVNPASYSKREQNVNISTSDIQRLFDNPEGQQRFLDKCLERTLDLFSLPIDAKEDLTKAIMAIALKYNAFTPPKGN